jgi:hypothetical protein
MKRGIPSDWIKSLPEAERVEFEKSLRHSTTVLTRLQQIVDEKLFAIEREENSTVIYDTPSWAYKQAHLNGERSGLTKIKNLLSFLDQGS